MILWLPTHEHPEIHLLYLSLPVPASLSVIKRWLGVVVVTNFYTKKPKSPLLLMLVLPGAVCLSTAPVLADGFVTLHNGNLGNCSGGDMKSKCPAKASEVGYKQPKANQCILQQFMEYFPHWSRICPSKSTQLCGWTVKPGRKTWSWIACYFFCSQVCKAFY